MGKSKPSQSAPPGNCFRSRPCADRVKYLILGGALSGIGTGCWYVAEAGAIMSLAPSGARGKYLALWIVSRNLGQLVGGAIK